jgi:hypothetical protein
MSNMVYFKGEHLKTSIVQAGGLFQVDMLTFNPLLCDGVSKSMLELLCSGQIPALAAGGG